MSGIAMTTADRRRDVAGRRVGVIGMARSGLAAARLLARHGAEVFASDAADPQRLAAATTELDRVGVAYETGAHTDRVLDVDFVVVSPGVPLSRPILQDARARGLPIYSELEVAWWFCRAPVVAVTGSNGKTTTTSLIGHMFTAGGSHAEVCGNIGRPLADVVDDLPASGVAVVEVSSFQLETIDAFRPEVALILNLQADHLDRHGSFEAYALAKYRIAANQSPSDVLITNLEDPTLRDADLPGSAWRLTFTTLDEPAADAYVKNGRLVVRPFRPVHPAFGTTPASRDGVEAPVNLPPAVPVEPVPVLPTADIRLSGRHNLANAAAASLACVASGVRIDAIAEALRTFAGVEHRIEPCGEVAGVLFVNDSKATNVDATCVALAAMDRPTVLILGGRHKGAPYTPIASAGAGRLKSIIAIGESRDRIAADLACAFPLSVAPGLDDAVTTAFAVAAPGDVVLLSPACASFDMFTDFEARGRAFKAAVAELAARHRRSP
jgi:UDP-N-acetylmuramoylalanine--D-glutamate ligase